MCKSLISPCQDATPTSNCQPIRLLDPGCCYKFTCLMANSADPDLQKPINLDLHSLQRQVIRVPQDKSKLAEECDDH